MPIHAKVSGTPIWQVPGSPVPPSRDDTTSASASMPPAPLTVPPCQDVRGPTLNPIERLRLAALQVSQHATPPINPRPLRDWHDRST